MENGKVVLAVGTAADNEEVRLLKHAGYSVELAGSMEEAALKLNSKAYCRVIVDPIFLHNPDHHGVDDEAEESRRILEALLEYVPAVITIADAPDMRVRIRSKYGWELTGSEPESMIGVSMFEHPERWELLDQDGVTRCPIDEVPLTRAIKSGEVILGSERLIRRPDGTVVPVLVNAAPIRDRNGIIVGGIAVWSDISEQKRTEEALRTALEQLDVRAETLESVNEELSTTNEEMEAGNEELRVTAAELQSEVERRTAAQEKLQETQGYLENLLNYANAPIIVWDPDFNITRFNHAFEYLTGYSSEEIVGENLLMLFPDESREESLKKITRTLAGEYWESVEIPIRRKDGAVRLALWNSANLYADEGTTLIATIAQGQDITERKQAEEGMALAQADAERRTAEMESILASAADGVMLVDRNGSVAFINEAGKMILGAPPGEDISEDIVRVLRTTPEGDLLPEEELAPLRALRGETVREIRHRIAAHWGSELVLSFSASPILDSHGRATGATAVFRDVSILVELERKREELYRREHHIAEMLQEALVPAKVAHQIEGCRMAVRYEPAWREAEVGGDFYDVFDLGDGKVGILIGDVAGKGLLAAIRVASARYAIRSYAYLKPSPGVVMALANDALSKENADGTGMLTAFFAVLDTLNGTLTFASGGHEPPMLCEAGGALSYLEVEGRALGVLEGAAYREGSRRLESGDKVIMLTDGITEARTADNRTFGREGLEAYVADNHTSHPEGMASGLLEAAREYANGSLQDDVAIVIFELL